MDENRKKSTTKTTTRERILEASMVLFAKNGFLDTSTREITDAAGVNIAAINYHFGSKEELYRELIRKIAVNCQRERLGAMDKAHSEGGGLEDILRAFIKTHLEGMLTPEGPNNEMALFFREFSSPGLSFDIIMSEMVEPTHNALTRVLTSYIPGLTNEAATLCIVSLMGQIIHFVKGEAVFSRFGGKEYDPKMVDTIVEHILSFSLRGLNGMEHNVIEKNGMEKKTAMENNAMGDNK
jgi:AcrR family transcriptional regulator